MPTNVLMNSYHPGQHRAVLDVHMACDEGTVGDDGLVSHD
jgi:hypothetical protein